MSREFEVMEEARNLHQEKYNCEGICPDFIKGVNWADQHPREGLWDAEKVIEWLENHVRDYKYYDCDFQDGNIDVDDLVESLRKAMEDNNDCN